MSLTPASGHGHYGRTFSSISVGTSRNKNGSAKRVQAHMNAYGVTSPPNDCNNMCLQFLQYGTAPGSRYSICMLDCNAIQNAQNSQS